MKFLAELGGVILLFFLIVPFAHCDIPVNCTYEDARGNWIFYETERSHESDINCSNMGTSIHKNKIFLKFPNMAVDMFGNKGTWTMIYNEGFEVRVGGRSYFAFFNYTINGTDVTSFCDQTFNGWSRDITVRNWACFNGRKVTHLEPKVHSISELKADERMYMTNHGYIQAINNAQSSWTAKVYPEYERQTLKAMHQRAGAKKVTQRVETSRAKVFTHLRSMILPDNFDWRNVSGVNYVSPVRNQGNCGSCYAFSAMAGLESRVRVLTKNEQTPVFSVQDILECSNYSQGCDGGFPYLIAGRYAQDFGVVLEECSKYDPEHAKSTCTTDPSCIRHYTAYYRYVGGYYGACNGDEMKIALVKGGPLTVGLQVYSDLSHYQGGIYHHTTTLTDNFNPWEETNHAVLVVGYGIAPDTREPFWIVKNSWGTLWGEEGYFRIRRGTDECGIESMAVEIVPIPA